VIGSNDGLNGFYGGLFTAQLLLALERCFVRGDLFG
jgi:hypothetical protein